MRALLRTGGMLTLVAVGYVLGSAGFFSPSSATAQQANDPLNDQHKERIKLAYDALNAAQATLEQDDLYEPAVKGLNSFAVLAGGIDVRNDLETTQTVDPETFAGLYADLAVDEIAADITFDEEGRLLYKNKIVRMYPISRIRQLIAQRRMLGGVEDDTLPAAK
ncbi:MAG: hypothetical protein KY476_01495 [Planctomycetes bacterium]|nr:hypothetical protein [Planctomycetota bacterium]